MFKFFTSPKFAYLLLVVIILSIGGYFGIKFKKNRFNKPTVIGQSTKEPYTAFVDEVYDIITKNYWNKITDADLSNIFLLGTQKLASSTSISLLSKDKAGVEILITEQTKNFENNKKKEFVSTLCDIVLANLEPLGRKIGRASCRERVCQYV